MIPHARRLIFLILPLVMASCAMERQLATRFVMQETDVHVLLLPAPLLIKHYYPFDPHMVPPDSLFPGELYRSAFLYELNDTAYADYFFRSLTYHLEGFQVKVYDHHGLDDFLQTGAEKSYIFSIAQLELIEYQDTFYTSAYAGATLYTTALERVNLEQNTWFEFTAVDDHKGRMEVLFSNQHTSDYFDGEFVSDPNGRLHFEYTPFRLSDTDVYDLAYFAGARNAQFIFDHLMNRYVKKQLGERRRTPWFFYQYDMDRRLIRITEQDRFQVIHPQKNRHQEP